MIINFKIINLTEVHRVLALNRAAPGAEQRVTDVQALHRGVVYMQHGGDGLGSKC